MTIRVWIDSSFVAMFSLSAESVEHTNYRTGNICAAKTFSGYAILLHVGAVLTWNV